jgi:hypothetical protein
MFHSPLQIIDSGRLNRSTVENDFMLIINSIPCEIPTIVAELCSPNISNLRKIDPTILSYSTETHSPVLQSDLMKFFSYLQTGGDPPSLSDSFRFIELSLGVRPKSFSFPRLTKKNVIEILNLKHLYQLNWRQEITYIARNFSSVDRLNSLSSEHLLSILEDPELSIESEDWLLQFILDFMRNDPSGISLLEHVQVEFLSQRALADYAHQFDELDSGLVSRLWPRMRQLFMKGKETCENPRVKGKDEVRKSEVPTNSFAAAEASNPTDLHGIEFCPSILRSEEGNEAADLIALSMLIDEDISDTTEIGITSRFQSVVASKGT